MLNLEKARELLPLAVATQGRDFVYNPEKKYACRYTPQTDLGDDAPPAKTGCLIGVVLSMFGISQEYLRRMCGSITGSSSARYWTDDKAARYLQIAQIAQDNGKTWGEAYDEAEASLVADE